MSKRTKKFEDLVDKSKSYPLEEAVKILKAAPHPKFDEAVDLSFKLDIDPKQSEQMVRGSVTLPHGSGKKLKIAVFAKGEPAKFAEEAGADYVGGDDLVEKVNAGWVDFDVAVATPEMMKSVGRLGKILGPRGLMPNPKSGTVTEDTKKAIGELKKGKIEFKMDKQANIYVSVGKLSFPEEAIVNNASATIEAILHARPHSVKGQYIKNAYITSTMGPGVKMDLARFR